MIRLPISGVQARWRPATGHDDIALADSRPGLAGALSYVAQAATLPSGIEAASLPVGDLDLLIVARRRELRGDMLVAEGRCGQCASVVDVQFSLAAYADHHRPRPSRIATPSGDGWFTLRPGDLSFRPPTVADVLAAAVVDDQRGALLGSCTRGVLTPRQARTVEGALARTAPTLRADVAGTCPECSAPVLLDVDARELCMTELRFLAALVYDDINLVASMYRWTQDAILDLPSTRRRRYADMIAGRTGTELEVPVA
jgi:hypothetical protein